MRTKPERRPFWGVWFVILCALPSALGQSLQLTSQTAAPGEWATLEISFHSPPDRQLVALQWEVEIPSGLLDPETSPVTRAPLAIQDAGKSVTCVAGKKTAEALLLPCIVAGNQKPVPSGAIVLVSLKIASNARPGMARIRLQGAIAVTSDVKQVAIDPAEAVVTIRAR